MTITSVESESVTDDEPTYIIEVDQPLVDAFLLDNHCVNELKEYRRPCTISTISELKFTPEVLRMLCLSKLKSIPEVLRMLRQSISSF